MSGSSRRPYRMQPSTDAVAAGGYIIDTAYTSRYHAAQNPLHVNYVAALNGFPPVPLDEPFTYLDLGCATGVNVNLMAGMFPRGRFYGVDVHNEHIAGARRQAHDGALTNVRFHVRCFSELETLEIEPLDFVSIYGTFTWISPAQQANVLDFVARRLKPGGRFLVHYAALPGKAQPPAMWHLVREITRDMPGGSAARVQTGVDLLCELRERGALFFNQNPLAAARLQAMATQDIAYLAHEILNEHTAPLYHAQLARALAAKGLEFGGNADLMLEHVSLGMPARFRALIEAQQDRIARETLKDFTINNGIRIDVYVKGRPSSNRLALLAGMIFGHLGLADDELPVSIEVKAASPALRLVRTALTDRAIRLSDLMALPELRAFSATQIADAVQALVAAGGAWPFLEAVTLDRAAPTPAARASPATPLVRTLIAGADRRSVLALPSHRWGNAYMMPRLRATCLQAWLDDRAIKKDAIWRRLHAHGDGPSNGDRHSRGETMRTIAQELERVRTYVLPRLRALGIVE